MSGTVSGASREKETVPDTVFPPELPSAPAGAYTQSMVCGTPIYSREA